MVRLITGGTATIKGIGTNTSGRFVVFISNGCTVEWKHNASTEAQSVHLKEGAAFAMNDKDVIAFVWLGFWLELFRSANT